MTDCFWLQRWKQPVCVCVCVCVCVRARACVCVCVCLLYPSICAGIQLDPFQHGSIFVCCAGGPGCNHWCADDNTPASGGGKLTDRAAEEDVVINNKPASDDGQLTKDACRHAAQPVRISIYS